MHLVRDAARGGRRGDHRRSCSATRSTCSGSTLTSAASVFGDPSRLPNAHRGGAALRGAVAVPGPRRDARRRPITASTDPGRRARRARHRLGVPRRARVSPTPTASTSTRKPEREVYFGHGHHCVHREEPRAARDADRARGDRRALPDYEVDESGITRTYQAHVKGYVNLPIATRAVSGTGARARRRKEQFSSRGNRSFLILRERVGPAGRQGDRRGRPAGRSSRRSTRGRPATPTCRRCLLWTIGAEGGKTRAPRACRTSASATIS